MAFPPLPGWQYIKMDDMHNRMGVSLCLSEGICERFHRGGITPSTDLL